MSAVQEVQEARGVLGVENRSVARVWIELHEGKDYITVSTQGSVRAALTTAQARRLARQLHQLSTRIERRSPTQSEERG